MADKKILRRLRHGEADKSLSVKFGALARPLAEQLNRLPKDVKALQQSADAITWLLIRGLLSEAEGHRARRRLMKAISADPRR